MRTILSVLCFSSAILAQGAWLGVPMAFAERVRDAGGSFATADVDRDGDVDVLSWGGYGESHVLHLNDGWGRLGLAPEGMLPRGRTYLALFTDLDRDADADLLTIASLTGYLEPQLVFYRNDGRGRFTTEPWPVPGWWPSHLAVFDCDADGDDDILASGSVLLQLFGESLFLNDGQGRFTDATAQRLPTERFGQVDRLLVVDLDGDGDLDVVRSGTAGRTKLLDKMKIWANDGRGTFRDVSSQKVTGEHAALPTSALSDAVADIDQDGDADLLLLGSANAFLLNDGKGGFDAGRMLALPSVPTGFFGTATTLDADKNGAIDLLLHREQPSSLPLVRLLLLNQGKGNLVDATSTHLPALDWGYPRAMAADIDADGDLDLVGSIGDPSRPGLDGLFIHLNRGDGRFVLAPGEQLPIIARSAPPAGAARRAAGDVDGDGHLDLVVVVPDRTENVEPALLYRGIGGGRFVDATRGNIPIDPNPSHLASGTATLHDLDRDGDLDLVIGSDGYNVRCRVLHNDGKGRFAVVQDQPATSGWLGPLLFTDCDADGDLDLVSRSAEVWLNDGRSRFARADPRRYLHDRTKYGAIETDGADFDGDGDLDFVLTLNPTFSAGNVGLVLRNEGAGKFSEYQVIAGQWPAAPGGWRFTPLDSERHLDLVDAWTGVVLLYDGQQRVYRPEPRLDLGGRAHVLGDLDVDGATDAIVERNGGLRVLMRRGSWVDETAAWLPATPAPRVYDAFDLDGDGDLDLITDSLRYTLTNLTRQTVVAGASGVGKTVSLEVMGWSRSLCLTGVSASLGRLDLGGAGVWRLDPAATVMLPLTYLGDSAPRPGRVAIPLPIPRNSSLVGQTVWFQSLLIAWPFGPARVTNVEPLRLTDT